MICVRVRLTDHVKLKDLHVRCKITSLEQRRQIQLLLLMYTKSKDITMHKVFPSNTRISWRNIFKSKTDRYEGTLVALIL